MESSNKKQRAEKQLVTLLPLLTIVVFPLIFLSHIKNINQDKHPILGKLSFFEFLMKSLLR